MNELLKWSGEHPGIAFVLGLVVVGLSIIIFSLYKNQKKADDPHGTDHDEEHEEDHEEEHSEKDAEHKENSEGDKKDHPEKPKSKKPPHKPHGHHGTPQGFVASTLALATGLFALWCIWFVIENFGERFLNWGADKLFGAIKPPSVSPPTEKYAPPADTSLTVSLPQGKKTLVIVTKTYWYSDVMTEGTVADLIIEEPTQEIQFYPNVSTKHQPEGLHIPPGSKVYYQSKTPNGKVHVSHF